MSQCQDCRCINSSNRLLLSLVQPLRVESEMIGIFFNHIKGAVHRINNLYMVLFVLLPRNKPSHQLQLWYC